MEVRRLGEPLLRARASPLLSFLAPSVCPSWRPTSPARLCHYAFRRCQRQFSATTHYNSEDSTTTAAPEKPNKPRESITDVFDRTQRHQPPSAVSSTNPRRTDMRPRINAKIDELFPSKSSQSSPSSASDVADAFRASTNMNRQGLRSGSIAGSMLMPNINDSSSSTQRQVTASILSDTASGARRNKRTVRSRPAVGRTIEVEEKMGTDFGQAMKKLGLVLARNKVRQDQRRQKYHERGGAKRKRLKSERWRRYFQEGFKATVVRVQKMRRQGW